MIKAEKQEILSQIVVLLSELIETTDNASNKKDDVSVHNSVELVTIKEAVNLIHGLSEHTLRQLIYQNKISYIRSGQGKRGKILIYKDDLLNYFKKSA